MRGEFPQELLAGHGRFRAGQFAPAAARLAQLAHGQTPRALVIGCCDARVAPEFVFGAQPGELFVLRTIAGWVPPAARADGFIAHTLALEYAVRRLEIPHIIVLGHSDCGGVRAALDPPAAGLREPHAAQWLETLRPALKDLPPAAADDDDTELQTHAQQQTLVRALKNLRSFAFVDAALRARALSLHGAWFDIGNAALHILNPQTGAFEAFETPPPHAPAPAARSPQ